MSIKVLFCASEVAPFAKTGGLADVAGSLPAALGALGIEVQVFMPKYRGIDFSEKKIAPNVNIRFVDHEAYFNRSGLYGNSEGDYPDNLERFSFFSHECLRLTKAMDFRPDVVHAHDWHTALLPVLLKTKFSSDDFFKKASSVLTIHNLAYQGSFRTSEYEKLEFPESLFSVEGFEFYGRVNVLKAGLLFADRLNAVSPTYAEEIQTEEFGCGLEGVLQKRKKILSGILNGIDNTAWNPMTDPKISAPYSALDLSGKEKCKAELQKKCGFEVNAEIPVLAVVSRLAHQKGLDLLVGAAHQIFSQSFQLVVLGDGDAECRKQLEAVGHNHKKNAKIFIGFNTSEAHAIYSGADLFLMPSLFEPCGLGQLISMRYGTVPVVRATGGLKDTVIDADKDFNRGNGFVFEKANAAEFLDAIDRAAAAFKDRARWKKIVKIGMKADFSWDQSAQKYKKLYEEVA